MPLETGPKPARPMRRMVYAWLDESAFAAFERAAAERGQLVDVIVGRAMTAIATDRVLGAILDRED